MTRHAPAIRRRTPLTAIAIGGLGTLVAAALVDPSDRAAGALDRRAQRALRWRWWERLPHTTRLLGGRHSRRFEINQALGGLGGRWPTLVGGALTAAAVARRHGARQALPVALAVPLALGAHLLLKVAVDRRRPYTARLTGKTTPSFPSGHAARAAALTGIASHVAMREGLVSAAVSLPVAGVISVAGGVSRIPIDRHWTTDLVGGWALGAATAALCALWYDALLAEREAGARPAAPRVRHRSGAVAASAAPRRAGGVNTRGVGAGASARADDEGDVP